MAKRRVGEPAPAGIEGGQPGDIAIRGPRSWKRLAPGVTANDVLTSNGPGQEPSWKPAPGAGGGDSITVNAAAIVDGNLNDSTPAAPAGGELVLWQKDAGSPAAISAYVREATSILRGLLQLAGQLGGSAAAPDVRGLRTTSGPTLLTIGAIADGETLIRSGATIIGSAGGGGGDNVSVNGVAAADADFDDATPAAPTGGDAGWNGLLARWQKDAGSPNNISAYLGKDANGNWIIGFSATPSAVNYLGLRNAIAGAKPGLFARGTDTNVDLALSPKGTGFVFIGDGSVGSAAEFIEMAAPGTPPANDLRVYAKDADGVSGLYIKNDAGTERRLVNPITKALSANQTSSSVTPAKVTNLDQVAGPGTWAFQYFVRYQSSVTGTGVRFDVNHSGTVTSFVWNQRQVDVSATAATAAPDQDQIGAASAVMGAFASRAKGTAGRGTTLSVDTANADMLTIIEGLMVVTASGNLELYFGSEATGSTQTIMQDSALILTKIG